eukprot:6238969-Prymnesium_polylepis.1
MALELILMIACVLLSLMEPCFLSLLKHARTGLHTVRRLRTWRLTGQRAVRKTHHKLSFGISAWATHRS